MNKQNNEQDNIIYSSTGSFTGDVEYALPVEEKDRGFGKSGTKHRGSAKDDLNDYIYMTPVKNSSSHKKEKKKKKLWLKILIGILIGLIVLILSGIITLFVLINVGKGAMLDANKTAIINVPTYVQQVEQDGKTIVYNGKTYKYNEAITSILFMGIDRDQFADDDENLGTNGDADALMLLTYDTSNGNTDLISISRDTMADIDVYSKDGTYIGIEKQQICLAYAYGDGKETSCTNQVNAVSRLFYNIPISSYLSMDLDAVSVLNDAVGGVTVTSPQTFKEFTKGETVTLYGESAETFVRNRDTSVLDSNNSRMERQRVYIESFFKTLAAGTKENLMLPVDLFNAASPYTVTNIDIPKVTYLASNILEKDFSEIEMQNVPGEVVQGEVYAEYHLDQEKFFEMFLNVYYTPVD